MMGVSSHAGQRHWRRQLYYSARNSEDAKLASGSSPGASLQFVISVREGSQNEPARCPVHFRRNLMEGTPFVIHLRSYGHPDIYFL